MTDSAESLGRAADPIGSVYRFVARELLWAALRNGVLTALPPKFRFCDVGSSGGGWPCRILAEYPEATGLALCRTQEAYSDGLVWRRRRGYETRLQVVRMESADVGSLEDESFDAVFSLDDLVARAQRPDVLLSDFVRITVRGGLIAFLVPDLHHAVLLNLANARVAAAECALHGRGTLAPDLAELNLYTPRSIEELLKGAGACPRVTLGVPATVHPSSDEMDGGLRGLTSVLSDGPTRTKIRSVIETLLRSGARLAHGEELLSVSQVPPPRERWGDYWACP